MRATSTRRRGLRVGLAVVLLAAIFNLAIYLIVDIAHFLIDPRVEL